MDLNIPNSLLVKIRATHFNFINKNYVLYTESAVTKGAKSWTKPFRKPQLVAHNTKGDPIGRIIDYEIIKDDKSVPEAPNYILLTVKITDKSAIEKVLDGRYSTVSVGSSSSRVLCSECEQVLTEDGFCEHKKGTYNEKGLPIYWIIDQITYTEDSFVNEPADEYTQIDQIMINGEWVNYIDFSDNIEEFLNGGTFNMLDNKLSAEQREKLPVSAFCGPNRSFPGHDEAHVKAGLRLLDNIKVSDETKGKIRSCLYRKGKQFDITPLKDEVSEDFDILYRMEDEFTEEEITAIDSWFKENPDSDLPEVKNSDENKTDNTNHQQEDNTSEEDKDIGKMKRAELQDEVKKLKSELEDAKAESEKAIDLRDKKIKTLEEKVRKAETIAYEKDDQLNKYIDKVCVFEQKYKDSVISNIIDFKLTDNNDEEREQLTKNLKNRVLDSLEDTLKDLRTEKFGKAVQSKERVEDPGKEIKNQDQKKSDNKASDSSEETSEPRFKIFSVDRRKTEAE